MNTTAQSPVNGFETILLSQGYFAKRNTLDWLFAVAVLLDEFYTI